MKLIKLASSIVAFQALIACGGGRDEVSMESTQAPTLAISSEESYFTMRPLRAQSTIVRSSSAQFLEISPISELLAKMPSLELPPSARLSPVVLSTGAEAGSFEIEHNSDNKKLAAALKLESYILASLFYLHSIDFSFSNNEQYKKIYIDILTEKCAKTKSVLQSIAKILNKTENINEIQSQIDRFTQLITEDVINNNKKNLKYALEILNKEVHKNFIYFSNVIEKTEDYIKLEDGEEKLFILTDVDLYRNVMLFNILRIRASLSFILHEDVKDDLTVKKSEVLECMKRKGEEKDLNRFNKYIIGITDLFEKCLESKRRYLFESNLIKNDEKLKEFLGEIDIFRDSDEADSEFSKKLNSFDSIMLSIESQ